MAWVHVRRFNLRGMWHYVVVYNMNKMYILMQTGQLYPQKN
jgi:hypothetical protein